MIRSRCSAFDDILIIVISAVSTLILFFLKLFLVSKSAHDYFNRSQESGLRLVSVAAPERFAGLTVSASCAVVFTASLLFKLSKCLCVRLTASFVRCRSHHRNTYTSGFRAVNPFRHFLAKIVIFPLVINPKQFTALSLSFHFFFIKTTR